MNAELGYNIAKRQIIDFLNENVFWDPKTRKEYIKPRVIKEIEEMELNTRTRIPEFKK